MSYLRHYGGALILSTHLAVRDSQVSTSTQFRINAIRVLHFTAALRRQYKLSLRLVERVDVDTLKLCSGLKHMRKTSNDCHDSGRRRRLRDPVLRA
jgi:hypothetical protein